MHDAVQFIARNDWLVAAATITSLLSFMWLLVVPLRRITAFAKVAATRSYTEAVRGTRYRRMVVARRCADSSSYFIAYCADKVCRVVLIAVGALSGLVPFLVRHNAYRETIRSQWHADISLPVFTFVGPIFVVIALLPFLSIVLDVGVVSSRVMKLSERREASKRRK